jgi:hypothetical protein
MTVLDHRVTLPSWLCATCGDLWPCGEARQDLLRGFSRDQAGLERRMVKMLVLATFDLWTHGSTTYDRFVGFTTRAREVVGPPRSDAGKWLAASGRRPDPR